MNRKEFLQSCGLVCLSSVGLSAFLSGCKAPYYVPNTIANKQIIVNKLDLEAHSYALIRNENLPAPIYLSKTNNETGYSAVLMLCTHKGCELNAGSGYLICPCHGSEFSNTGKVLNPPAEQDLQKFRVFTDNEKIYIQL
jgi:cytochrome b6-f complex iron-sulfur subunit